MNYNTFIKMNYTSQREKHAITTIIPPSFLSPPSDQEDEKPKPTIDRQTSSRGWYSNHIISSWAHRDPRLKRYYKPQTLDVQDQQKPEFRGYFTASKTELPSEPSMKKQRVSLSEHKDAHDDENFMTATTKNALSADEFSVPSVSCSIDDLLTNLLAVGMIKKPKTEIPKEDKKLEKTKEIDKVAEVDLLNPASLRIKQPGLISRLHSGLQCSGCSTRFPPAKTSRYSQHLDWHFRQNRLMRKARRKAMARPWYYVRSDWMQFEETEELETRPKSWFEIEASNKGTAKEPEEVPSVVMGARIDDNCSICGDKFETFYNEEDDEWYLKNAIRNEDRNCHPTCLLHQKVDKDDDEVVAVSTGRDQAK